MKERSMQNTMEKPRKTKGAGPVDLSMSTRMVEVPFVSSAKYAQREVHSRLDVPQAATLRAIFEGLEQRHAKLANGQRVATPQDALRWLLEAVAGS
jgi:hypothetical protein